jgi:hypothetical protein
MCNVPEEFRAALFGVPQKTEEPVDEIPVCVDEPLVHDLVHG